MALQTDLKLTKLKGHTLACYKQSLTLTYEQREVIFGALLGKCSMSLRKGKPTYSLKFEYSSNKFFYACYIYNILKPFIGQKFISDNSKKNSI